MFNKKNAFDLLGFKDIKFSIAKEEIENAYKAKMLEFHPDRFCDSQEKLKAIQISADINDAYHLLKDPYKKGMHMIEILGKRDKITNTIDDEKILMESFMMQEEINNEDDHEKLFVLQEQNKKRADQLVLDAVICFEQEKDIDGAIRNLNALRYTQKIAEQIGAKIRK